ncbi:hypothetical protein [Kordia sp.]|uniref:hypothetical protein n=1 Tax=Kordia sp. TaxID=1965332 RepID=UPI003D6B50C7
MHLKPGKFILFIGLFCFAISLVLLYVMFFVIKDNQYYGFLSVILMFLGFLGFAMYFLLHYFRYSIQINETFMVICTEFGKKKEVHLKDINHVYYHKRFNMIVIVRNKKKIWISPIYGQFTDFIPAEKLHLKN